MERENREQPAADAAHGGRGAGKGCGVAKGRGAARGCGVARGHSATRAHGGNRATAWVPRLHEEQSVSKLEYCNNCTQS